MSVPWVLVLLLGLMFFFLLLAVQALVQGRQERRLLDLDRRIRGADRAPLDLARAARLAEAEGLERLLSRVPGSDQLDKLLVQADSPWSVADLVVRCIGSGVAGAIVIGLLLRGAFGGMLGLFLGGALPIMLVMKKRGDRSAQISSQMPEALEMLSRSLQAGHPLEAAMEVVGSELAAPLGKEFSKCREEQKLGRSFEDSVVALANRVPGNMELRIFAVAATVLRETGGNLVQVLDKLGVTLRERQLFQQKVKTLTADSRASGQILALMPVGMLLLLLVMNPGYLGAFISDPLGVRIGLVGLTCWTLGVYSLRRMSKVKL